jgi:hypothetical protein
MLPKLLQQTPINNELRSDTSLVIFMENIVKVLKVTLCDNYDELKKVTKSNLRQ